MKVTILNEIEEKYGKKVAEMIIRRIKICEENGYHFDRLEPAQPIGLELIALGPELIRFYPESPDCLLERR